MKKTLSSVIAGFVLLVAAAVAQTSSSPTDTGGDQGTQSASPTQTSPSNSPTVPPSQRSSSQSTGMGSAAPQDSSESNHGDGMKNDSGVNNDSGMKRDSRMKGDKRLKGCVQSSGGQYMLEEKKGKMANLNSSQDLLAHVGHMVALHGHWGAKGSSDMSSSSSGSSAATNQVFYVDSVDMISDTCLNSKSKHKSGSKDTSNFGKSPQHD